jgi:DNA-binding MarR family transcriptional regulator
MTDEQLGSLLRGEKQLQARHLKLLAILPPGGLSVQDAAHAMRISTPWASRTATLLVRHGYIKRMEGEDDRRVAYLTPTPSGLALAARVTVVSRSRRSAA